MQNETVRERNVLEFEAMLLLVFTVGFSPLFIIYGTCDEKQSANYEPNIAVKNLKMFLKIRVVLLCMPFDKCRKNGFGI